MCVPRSWSASESQELREHLSSINILDILGSQCTETPLTDCATCQSSLPSTLIGPGQLRTYLSLPRRPAGLCRVPTRWNASGWGRAALTEREDRRGGLSSTTTVGFGLAVSQLSTERGKEEGVVSLPFSSTGRAIHPSFAGHREIARYQCSNVISLALSRAPECCTGSGVK